MICLVVLVWLIYLSKCCRSWQGSNLRGQSPLDFKSNALTTRPQQLNNDGHYVEFEKSLVGHDAQWTSFVSSQYKVFCLAVSTHGRSTARVIHCPIFSGREVDKVSLKWLNKKDELKNQLLGVLSVEEEEPLQRSKRTTRRFKLPPRFTERGNLAVYSSRRRPVY